MPMRSAPKDVYSLLNLEPTPKTTTKMRTAGRQAKRIFWMTMQTLRMQAVMRGRLHQGSVRRAKLPSLTARLPIRLSMRDRRPRLWLMVPGPSPSRGIWISQLSKRRQVLMMTGRTAVRSCSTWTSTRTFALLFASLSQKSSRFQMQTALTTSFSSILITHLPHRIGNSWSLVASQGLWSWKR